MFMLCFVAFYVGYVFLSETRRYAMMSYVLAFNLFFAYKASLSLAILLPIVTVVSWTLTRFLSRSVRHRRLWLVATVGLELLPLPSSAASTLPHGVLRRQGGAFPSASVSSPCRR